MAWHLLWNNFQTRDMWLKNENVVTDMKEEHLHYALRNENGMLFNIVDLVGFPTYDLNYM